MGTEPSRAEAAGPAVNQPGGTIPRPVAERGISMKMLQDFLRAHPEAVNASTVAVVQLVVALTREHQCSYAELPASALNDGDYYGPATHFVSHARSCMFGELVDVISREEEEQREDTEIRKAAAHADPAVTGTVNYYWIDVFAMNHHQCTTKAPPQPPPGRSQQQKQPAKAAAETEAVADAVAGPPVGGASKAESAATSKMEAAEVEATSETEAAEAEARQLVEQLAGVVRRCHTTLALLSPWEAPTALGQAWCLFEHMVALAAHGPGGLKYVTSRSQEQDLLIHVRERHEQLMQLVSGVDIRTCRASREVEKAAMLAHLASCAVPPQHGGKTGNSSNPSTSAGCCGGIAMLNAGVRAALQQWLSSGVTKAEAA